MPPESAAVQFEGKPTILGGRQTFDTPSATRFRSGFDSALIFLHLLHLRFSPQVYPKKTSRHQQDLAHHTFFCSGLTLRCLTEGQLSANRDRQLSIPDGFSHEPKSFRIGL